MKKRTRILVLIVGLLLLAATGGVGAASTARATRPLDSAAMHAAAQVGGGAGPRVIDITAQRFKFTPNLITVKRGETVTLRLTSQDVTHGFFLKPLKIDEVIVPGKPTELILTPQLAGRFTTICDHFCGSGHGNMNMTIVVE